MDKELLQELKELYLKEKELRDKELSLLNENTKEYLKMNNIEPKKIKFNEEIILELLKNYNYLNGNEFSRGNIYIDEGKYALFNEDTIFECEYLVKPEEVDEIIKKYEYTKGFDCIYNHYFNLNSGTLSYGIENKEDNVIIMLPSLKEKIDNLANYDGTNSWRNDEERSYYGFNYDILRAQYFISLIDKGIDETISFYSNLDNIKTIEDNLNKFKERKKTK